MSSYYSRSRHFSTYRTAIMGLEDCKANIVSQPYEAAVGRRLGHRGIELRISAPCNVNMEKVVMTVYHPSIDGIPPRVRQIINFLFDERSRWDSQSQDIAWSYQGKASDIRGIYPVTFNFDFYDTEGREFSYACVSEPIYFH